MKRTLVQSGTGHPDQPLIVGGELWRLVAGARVVVSALMEVDVAVSDGMRVPPVRIVDVLRRHDRSQDQARRECERDKRAAEQRMHPGDYGCTPTRRSNWPRRQDALSATASHRRDLRT